MARINTVIAERYLLKKLIGQGGMADVYLADDTILKRTVAVKVMRSSLNGDPVYVTRFHREARAAAALSHKNIVEIYDVGEDGDDYYIVMEYVPGQTLKELIHKRGALHFVEAIDIMKQVVSAVSCAHALGIVHRDLKPQNIMVTDSGVVKIGDFGIASIQSLSQVTQSDTIMGSLHYLAPEIARGEKATPQSDIYALGIVFYELLRGEVPFNGESPVNIALKHMRDEIPSIRAFNQSISQSIENIIIKATAKNVKDRYTTAKEMYNDLDTCLSRKDEEKLVFECPEEESTPTIVAENKDFFTTSAQRIQNDEDKPVKSEKKKRIMIISGCVIGALIIFGIIYFLFLRPVHTETMPNVIHMMQDEAIDLLESKGYKVSETILQETSDQEKGIVLETNPLPNTVIDKNTEIELTVSSGQYIYIEDYVGKKINQVKRKLELQNIEVQIEKVISEKENGIILSQSIKSGEKIDPADSNTIVMKFVVSKGYEATVPNVLGLDIYKAEKVLKDSGFKVKLKVMQPPQTQSEIETMKVNIVMKQSIDAFVTVYKKGESITLEYYDKKPEIVKPDSHPGNPSQGNNGNNVN